MSYPLSDRDYDAVLRLSAEDRYDYFVDKVVEGDQVWSLKGADGWVVMTSEDGEECLPVWPHPDFAAAWATGEWADCEPTAVDLDAWLERWTPGMEKDGTMLAVFPRSDEEGLVVPPGEVRESIEIALAP